jgi:hypothetical protein
MMRPVLRYGSRMLAASWPLIVLILYLAINAEYFSVMIRTFGSFLFRS